MKNKGKRGFVELIHKGKRVGLTTANDTTMVVTIPTPKGWKCKRKNCTIDYKHEHTNFSTKK